nr:hypothetical protein [Calditrichia bacterium]
TEVPFFEVPALVLAGLLLFSCVQVNTLVTVHKDGSGTVRQVVMIKQGLSNLVKLFEGLGDDDLDFHYGIYDVEDLKRDAHDMGRGVRYVNSKPVRKDNYEGYSVTYEFDNINELRIDSKKHKDKGFEGMEGMTFHFEGGSSPTLTVNMDHDMKGESDIDVDEDGDGDLDMVKGFLEGMRFSMLVQVDGNIQETNATFRDGNNLILYDIDIDKIENPEALERLNGAHKRSIKETREVLKDLKGVKVELHDQMVVTFK